MNDCLSNQIATDFGCIPTDPGGFVSKFYGIGLELVGGIGVLGIIYGGYLLLSSKGNPMTIAKGKRYITYSIAGILLAVFAYVIIQIIAVNTLHLPGFSN